MAQVTSALQPRKFTTKRRRLSTDSSSDRDQAQDHKTVAELQAQLAAMEAKCVALEAKCASVEAKCAWMQNALNRHCARISRLEIDKEMILQVVEKLDRQVHKCGAVVDDDCDRDFDLPAQILGFPDAKTPAQRTVTFGVTDDVATAAPIPESSSSSSSSSSSALFSVAVSVDEARSS